MSVGFSDNLGLRTQRREFPLKPDYYGKLPSPTPAGGKLPKTRRVRDVTFTLCFILCECERKSCDGTSWVEASVSQLAKDISGSVIKVDAVQSEIRIADMQGSFSVQRDHLRRLCEAFFGPRVDPRSTQHNWLLPSKRQTPLSGRTRQ